MYIIDAGVMLHNLGINNVVRLFCVDLSVIDLPLKAKWSLNVLINIC